MATILLGGWNPGSFKSLWDLYFGFGLAFGGSIRPAHRNSYAVERDLAVTEHFD